MNDPWALKENMNFCEGQIFLDDFGAMTPWRASEKSLNIQWFLTSSPGLDLSLNKIEGKFAFDFYIMVFMKPWTDVRC